MNFNDFITTVLFAAIISTLIALIGIFLMVRWIYFDAKSRGVNPWPWILITAFISPNFIGLILYILTRPKSNLACDKCRHNITQEMNFCPSCGAKIDQSALFPLRKISNKSLIWGIVLFIFSITSFIGIGIYAWQMQVISPPFQEIGIFNTTYSRSMRNININNKWTCSFHSLNGHEQGRFKCFLQTKPADYQDNINFGCIFK